MGDKPADPMIRFGGEWTPAHEVWKKLETATVVVAAIEHFNRHFPNLSTKETREVVLLVQKRLKNIELRMPPRDGGLPDLGPVANQLLDQHTPEGALAALEERYGVQLELQHLVQLAGAAYVDALTREATEFEANRVLPEQTAELWNDSGRPAPGGGLWTAGKVSHLLHGKG
jgi:hypothetical protein